MVPLVCIHFLQLWQASQISDLQNPQRYEQIDVLAALDFASHHVGLMVGHIGGRITEHDDMQYGEKRIDFLNQVLHDTVNSDLYKAAGRAIGLGIQESVDSISQIGNPDQHAAKYLFPFHPLGSISRKV